MSCTKRTVIFLLTLFVVGVAKAQQAPHFTQNIFTQVYQNPAAAGMQNAICATGLLRSQWVGFVDDEGTRVSPEDLLVSVDSPVKFLGGGVSGVLLQSKEGYRKTVGIALGYSYYKELTSGTLGIGAQFKFATRSDEFGKYKPKEGDLSGISGEQSGNLLDFNLGLYYKQPESFYLGVSVANLLGGKSGTLNDAGLTFKGDRTFYLTAGYDYTLPNNPDFKIEPYLLFESNVSSFQLNIASLVKYKDKFWGGIGYRLQSAVSVMAGIQIKDIRVGYAYDIGLLNIGSSGTHEVMASYCFKLNLDKGKRIYRNTRFL
ncbi:MAG: PorP/SprF family type IX secretion system membrane protein [Bacteroidales bacterium]